jgi:hypothetical protein
MREQYGIVILFATLLFLMFSEPVLLPEPPLELEFDRKQIRTVGVLMRIVSDEMLAVADSENIEEHLLVKSEQIFDDFARESDFPGPDRLTKPLARKLVRPVVKTMIRYMDKKGEELSLKYGDTK